MRVRPRSSTSVPRMAHGSLFKVTGNTFENATTGRYRAKNMSLIFSLESIAGRLSVCALCGGKHVHNLDISRVPIRNVEAAARDAVHVSTLVYIKIFVRTVTDDARTCAYYAAIGDTDATVARGTAEEIEDSLDHSLYFETTRIETHASSQPVAASSHNERVE